MDVLKMHMQQEQLQQLFESNIFWFFDEIFARRLQDCVET